MSKVIVQMSTMSPSTQNGAVSGSRVRQLATYVREPVQALAFWVAIALPFTYLPLLVRGFEDGLTAPLAFSALVLANVVALVIGHGYGRD